LLSGTGTGDWPASIAVAPDPDGVEHAWVVWGRATMGTARPVQLVRLSGLDSPDGPVVGTPVTVDPGDQGGAVRPDLGFETGPDGRPRGVLTWVRRVASNSSELVAAWFTNLDTDTPAITGPAVLDQGTGRKGGTIVEAPDGVRIVAFAGTDRLSLIAHDPAMTWQPAQEGAAVQAYPTATVLDDGQILAAAESAAGVIVQQFSASGAPGPVELTLTGCTTPTIATDGERAWLVVVCDGRVVSRERAPDFSWSVSDRLEIGPEGGGGYAFPNALRRVEDRLRLVVRGPDGAPNGGRAAVLAYERPR